MVHPANIPDRQGGTLVRNTLASAWPRLPHIWADQGYTGAFLAATAQEHGVTWEVVYPAFRQLQRYAPA